MALPYRTPKPRGAELFLTETLPQIAELVADWKIYEKQVDIDSTKQRDLQANRDRTYQLASDKFTEDKRKTQEAERMSKIKLKTENTNKMLTLLEDLGPEATNTAIDAILEDTIYQTTDSEIVNSQREQLQAVRQGNVAKIEDNKTDLKAYNDFTTGNINLLDAVNIVGEDSKYLDDIYKWDSLKRTEATHAVNMVKAYASLGRQALIDPETGTPTDAYIRLVSELETVLKNMTPQGIKVQGKSGQVLNLKDVLPANYKDLPEQDLINHLLKALGEEQIDFGEPASEVAKDDSVKLTSDVLKDSIGVDDSQSLIDSILTFGVTTEYGKLDSADIFGLSATPSGDTTLQDTVPISLQPALQSLTVVPDSEKVNTITLNFKGNDVKVPTKAWTKVTTGEGRITADRAYQLVAKKLGISVDELKTLMFGHLKKK